MPELPEVETVRAGLAPVMEGAVIVRVDQRRADLRFPLPDRFAERLAGRTVQRMSRRSKYLLAALDGYEVLLMHLGMSGRFLVGSPTQDASGGLRRLVGDFVVDTGQGAAHDHVVLHLSSGATVTYNDPRRFGFMLLIAEQDLATHKLLAGLGPEPLSNAFDAVYLAGRAAGRTADLKAFLLDQSIVAGLGNIYVSEALFRAGLSPRRKAAVLSDRRGRPTARAEALVPAIRDVLGEAIAAGGSTLRDYRRSDGALGYFQHAFRVYDREGEPCRGPGCSGTIRRIVQAGRSTYYCPACQR